jgi:DNA invertase Pin-like site-specific DNA recombinase
MAAGCNEIFIQTCPLDKDSLSSCLESLNENDRLITWRLDKLPPRDEKKACWLSNTLSRGIIIFGLADNISLQQGEEHAGSRICHYFNRITKSHRAFHRKKCQKKLDIEQIENITHAIRNKQSTISNLAVQYNVSRTTLYATLKRYAQENDFE